jgi:hypothetical protein
MLTLMDREMKAKSDGLDVNALVKDIVYCMMSFVSYHFIPSYIGIFSKTHVIL